MKFKAAVTKLEDTGDSARITVENVQGVSDAEWRSVGPAISFHVPHSRAKSFEIGREVQISIEAKRTR